MGKQKDVKMPEIDFSKVENPSYSPEKNFVLVTKKLMKFIKRWCRYHEYVLYGYSKICKHYLSGSVDYVKTTILNGIKEQTRLLDSMSNKKDWQIFIKHENAFVKKMENELKRLETIDTATYQKIAFSQLKSVTFGNDDNAWNSFLKMDTVARNVDGDSGLLISSLKDTLKTRIEIYKDGKRFEVKLEKESKAIEKKFQAKIKKEDSPH